jgi:hypothetical protein
MAKRKEVINGLHNIFQVYTFGEDANGTEKDMYDISRISYEQSVDENTILFVIADSEDVGRYITINGEPKIISENDNFIITDGVVFSGNGGGSSDVTITGSEYTAGTNIDITDNVISAQGYTYANDNFYIGNDITYEIINNLDWDITYNEKEGKPEQLSISYNGANSKFDFNSIIKIGDFIRFFDVDNEGETICKVISVNIHNFSVDKFWPIAAAYTTVSKVVGGAPILVKNDGSIYVKNVGDYSGSLSETGDSVSSLQEVINMNSEAINDLYEQGSTGQEYTGSDNIHISEEGVITALGYNYVNGVTQLSKAQINNNGTFHFSPSSKLTSSYSNFNIVDTPITITKSSSSSTVNLVGVSVLSDSNITTTGSISAAQGFFETSDIRKKNVIDELPLDKAYELINNCQSIIYTLKDNTDKQQIGLIAQEVQQYFPEVVSEDKDGYLSLDYAKLTSVIFRVLKDVIDRLNKLENK